MTPADLDRIEVELQIALPASYRRVMSAWPIPYEAGNCDSDLWDDAEALIGANRELRSRADQPWPKRFLFIGDPQTACANAIDLDSSQAAVWWFDHCDLEGKGSGRAAESFDAWSSQYVAARRGDLVKDGIDPDAPRPVPEPRERAPLSPWRVAVALALLAALAWWLLHR